MEAVGKWPDPQGAMGGLRRINQRRGWQTSPEGGVISDARGKGIHRNIAERMVGEMAEQVGEQNQPTSQTDLPDADAADVSVKVRAIELSHAHNFGFQTSRSSGNLMFRTSRREGRLKNIGCQSSSIRRPD